MAKRSLSQGLGRRAFFKLSGLTTTALSGLELTACGSSDGKGTSAPAPTFSANLLRKEDLVSLRFDFYGLALNDDGSKLVGDGADERLIVVTHAPQHLLEKVLQEDVVTVIEPPPVDARLSGPSRVALRVPKEVTSIGFDAESLLAVCAEYPLQVGKNALPPQEPRIPIFVPIVVPSPDVGDSSRANIGISHDLELANDVSRSVASSRVNLGAASLSRSSGGTLAVSALDPSIVKIVADLEPTTPTEPGPLETALELPYRLLLSPNQHGQFAHATAPQSSPTGRVELWHSRLGVRNQNGVTDESASGAAYRTVRALWTRDAKFDASDACTYDDPQPPEPFLDAMTASDRIAIVHQSSNFTPKSCNPKGKTSAPEPIHVDRLMLTALGGYLTADGSWGESPSYGLETWKHRATLGRDQYVELVHSGVLYPFGHRASLVTITERKLIAGNSQTESTAFLWQRSFLVVRQPVVSYPDGLRKFPYSQLHIKTLSTPNLSNPPDLNDLKAMVPEVDAMPYRFAAEGLDREGKLTQLSVVAVWIPSAGGAVDPDDGAALYAALDAETRSSALAGQRLAFAKSSRPDDTTYEVESLTFAGSADTAEVPKPPKNLGFYPLLEQAKLQVEAVRHLSGQNAAAAFKYADAYRDFEFSEQNAGELLLQLAEASPIGLDFSHKSDRSGGFVAPSLDISGLSRLVGPIAGDLSDPSVLSGIVGNTFDPASFFPSSAKLFGVFSLGDVIAAVAGADGGLLKAPKFVTQALSVVEDLLQTLAQIQNLANELKADLEAGAAAVEKALDDVADAAKTLVTDIADIDPDPDKLEDSVAKVIDDDLPGLLDALEAAANLFGMSPVPPQLAKLSDGPRRAFKQALDQVRDALDAVKDTLHDALKAFCTGYDALKNLSVKLDWRPKISGFPVGAEIFHPNKEEGLLLQVEVRAKDVEGKKAGVDMLCSLEDFELRLIASKSKDTTCIILKFKKVGFTLSSGKKPDIDVVLDDIVFDGPLAFVEELKKLIPLDGFSDPPSLDVSTEGIKAEFSLGLPSVAIGVFSLTNLSFAAGFRIPFIGDPLSVSFYFCTRENPFHLTVSFLGGGGFFGISLAPDGIQVLEAALEFGAALSVDFGVASGSVSAMAGIYFRMEKTDAQLTGYFRLRGEVDVLGIISASIELYLELMYEFSTRKLVGQATLEIEVSIAFFSVSVSLHAERKFAGSNNDPTFEQMMGPEGDYRPWDDYLAAFAAA